NNGANTNNVIDVPSLTIPANNTLNVTANNGYILRIESVNDGAPGSGAAKINVPGGATVQVFGWTGDKPVNVGPGALVFPDIVTIGQTTTLNGGAAIALNGSYPLVIQKPTPTSPTFSTGTAASFGLASGGLATSAYSYGSALNTLSQNT